MSSEIIKIDINCDLGEGFGKDSELMPLISSCSIACGGHYGDETSMSEAVQLAMQYGVRVGAHPSFPDQDNFGRKKLFLTKEELKETVFNQLLQFYAVCEQQGCDVHHVKLHGALYHCTAANAAAADAVVEAITALKSRPVLYVPYGSVLHKKAENLLPLAFEAFIDRRYINEFKLADRAHIKAVIHSPELAFEQLLSMVKRQKVTSIIGEEVPVQANTYCIHGDHHNSVLILEYIHSKIEQHNLAIG